MAAAERPAWAARLREERTRRLWSQKVAAIRLRDAADPQTRSTLPPIDSIRRYVRDYEAGRHLPGDLYAELYCRAFGLTYQTLFGNAPANERDTGSNRTPTEHDARSLISWVAATNASDDAISNIDQTILALSESHTRRPPAELLTDVIKTHEQIQNLLRTGKQRLAQARDLYHLDADVLAHAALLLGDLYHDGAAAAYGSAALTLAKEADSNEAIAYSVQAKTERWRLHFGDSANLARQGFEHSPATPIRILLACQEANAAALHGDMHRAREAMNRAQDAADGPVAQDSGVAAWSCPRPRQALYAMSVATRFGDPDAALRAAAIADAAWAAGEPRADGTWAQVRLGSGIAYIMNNDLDGAMKEIVPVLALTPEFRMATITDYTVQIDKRLQQRRFGSSPTAAAIRRQLKEFNASALSTLRT
jgi:transcriptional regulator with XRE-family HTH domain